MKNLKLYAATLVVFLALDATWLLLVANAFFKSELGPLLRTQPNLAAAAVFYLIYTGGVVILAVVPSLRDGSAKAVVWRGAAVGLTAYATFDLTNLAIIEGWTLPVTLVDMVWGTVVSAASSLAGYQVARLSSGSQEPVR